MNKHQKSNSNMNLNSIINDYYANNKNQYISINNNA